MKSIFAFSKTMDLTCRKQTNPLCFFITTYFLLTTTSHATTDTLSQTQSLKDNQTLISTGRVFQLGFFSPNNSSNRYVGIWYYNIFPLTVVWVANRNNPIKNNSSSGGGVLTFGRDNNLVVLDRGDHLLWSSNVSVASKPTHIRLLDSGNLVVESFENTVLWQSFDNPGDTFLPGMKVGLDLRTGVNKFFNSWTSEDDPSTGKFSLGISSDRSPQIVIHEGQNPHWRTGQWDGQLFTGIANMKPMYIYGFRLSNVEQEHKIYFDYTPVNVSSFVRFRLSWSGKIEHYNWDATNAKWETAWAQPISDCEVYNTCGDYGTCRETDAPICTCLQGFVAKDLEEWGRGNWSRGCVRRTPLACESGGGGGDDGFLKLEGVKYPDSWEWLVNVADEGGCRGECVKNCSCKAYAYVAGVGCVVWVNDLVDIHHFPSGGNGVFLRLAHSEFHDKKSHKVPWIIILIVILAVSPLKIILCVYYVRKCWKKQKASNDNSQQISLFDQSTSNTTGEYFLGEGTKGSCPDLSLFNFAAIEAATRNFSDSNKLGQGGFGPVYKGKMNDGRDVAVKRLSNNSGQGVEEFKNEVILIAKLQHRNLVRLLGCCIEGQEKILVYEYMPNRSLDSFLFDPTKQVLLNWMTRFSIIEGIARGLLYLHRDSRLRIVHRDLKVSNILLDEEMNPKISDFGMARIFGGNDNNQENTKRVMGTYGYMSPEYAMDGLFSMKSDVYSFGVLLLEILSGQKNNSFHHHQTSKGLLGYAWLLWSEDRVIEFVDPLIHDSCSTCEVLKCMHIGLLCVQDRPDDRPAMPSLVHMLASEAAPDAIPKQPTFTTEKFLNGREKSDDNMRSSSGNQVTLSVIVGR